jgi:D-alanine-D-alanine ligase
MRIGITYDLKDDYLALGYTKEACAEFDSIETIDAIDTVLKQSGHKTERIGNLFSLMTRLQEGTRWDLVFNISEGLHGRGREAQVPALLDAFQIPYIFSDTTILALTLDKALTKRVVRDAGVSTASFQEIAVGCQLIADSWKLEANHFPKFVKPNCEGTGKGITARSLVKTEAELRAAVQDIHTRFAQSALVETYLSGREFTVGITGTGQNASVIGVMEIILNEKADAAGYTYDNKQEYEERVTYHLRTDAEALKAGDVALQAWRVLGCRDGGRIDVRSNDKGEPHFLEVNPLAGLHPVLGDLVILSKMAGLSYGDLLGRMLDSALSDPQRFPQNTSPVNIMYA